MNLPTKITVTRMCLIPLMVLFFYLNFAGHYIVAAVVFAISAGTDFVDGYIARSRNMVTSLGKLLDPLADKVLTVVALFLIVEVRALYALGPFLCGIVLARELAISGVRQLAAVNNVVLAADKWGKFKTIFTNVSIPFLILSEHFVELGATRDIGLFTGMLQSSSLDKTYWSIRFIGNTLFVVAFILCVISAINYVIKNKQIFASISKAELKPEAKEADTQEIQDDISRAEGQE